MSKPGGRWADIGFDLEFEGVRYWISEHRPSGRFHVRWYEPGTREVRSRSLKTADPNEAKIILAAEILSGHIKPVESGPEQVMVTVLFNQYHDEYSDHRDNPREARRPCEYFLDFAGNDVKAAQVTQGMMDDFYRELADRDLSVATIERYASIIHAAINYGVNRTEEDLQRHGGVRLTQMPKWSYSRSYIAELLDKPIPRARDLVIPAETLAKLIDAIEEEHFLRYVVLAMATWARPAAVIDLEQGSIHNRFRLFDLLPPTRRQNNKVRPLVPIPEVVEPLLADWAIKDAKIKPALTHKRFIHWRGEPVYSVRSAFETAAKNAKHPELYPYAIRHTMATEARAAGVGRDDVEDMLGHTGDRSRTTMSYLHAGPDLLSAAREFTDGFIRKVFNLTDCKWVTDDMKSGAQVIPLQKREEETKA